MKAPLFIRPLSKDEQEQIQASLRSSSAFVLRRCQILLASARGEHATAIGRSLGCDDQTVRNVIKGFNEVGLAVLKRGSTRPHQLRTQISDDQLPALKTLLHRSPRDFGFQTSLWTVPLVAKVALQLGLCVRPISGTSLRRALKRLGVNWKRAKHWITSPDPAYQVKKTLVIG